MNQEEADEISKRAAEALKAKICPDCLGATVVGALNSDGINKLESCSTCKGRGTITQQQESDEMEKARKALAALFEEGTIKETPRPCPICKGHVDCEPCRGTGLKGAAYCPKCLGFGCCLHCRGQGIIIKDGPEAPCHVCGNIMGSHQACKIAEYQMARLEALLKQPEPQKVVLAKPSIIYDTATDGTETKVDLARCKFLPTVPVLANGKMIGKAFNIRIQGTQIIGDVAAPLQPGQPLAAIFIKPQLESGKALPMELVAVEPTSQPACPNAIFGKVPK